ncbi:MAG TPA: tRNA (adenosine(37)-N6)-threonylcarbamoyltransferase complex transferase subunit TsaD [Candidatus Limnocylindrales bacterium]|nr:tRNA (adenosine(37)-N6)-threonylcarbamoyltransferase complex transferase subunit TsaD [Candidatus Limnocylindrales bacterium]
MRVLGIETSCDDTSAAVVDDRSVLSNVIASQDAVHAPYGGVVPELAARRHLETITKVLQLALERASTAVDELDAIAVTRGPGLIGSLLVGVAAATGLSLRSGKPLLGINHLEGHVLSPLVHADIQMPFLALLVSGGHSSIYLVRDVGDYVEVACTRDDSAGEAFDKGAKMLGLGYPGGRVIDELSRKGNCRALSFPRARVKADPLALSFSGLKTSLWDYLSKPGGAAKEDICASFQEAIVDALVDRLQAVSVATGVDRIAVAGGVSANSRLREKVRERWPLAVFPPMAMCTDNGAMIAHAAILRAQRGLPCEELEVRSRLPLGPRMSRDAEAPPSARRAS